MGNNPLSYTDSTGLIIDLIWDFGNLVYDVYTENWVDAGADAVAMCIPGVPAGITKIIKLKKLESAAKGASRETIVIGEGMADRVIPTAKARGANWYDPPKAPPEKWMENNQKWINEKMDQGCRILDCGSAPGRTNYPNPTSPYYKIEIEQINQRNYPFYERINAVGE